MNTCRVVLVVEDEPLVRMDLVQTLEDAGYRCLEASSATEAIAILENHPEVRVVFTDVQMPGNMDGIELARCVRERWPPTIIVVASGKVDLASCLLPEGANRLAKPYDPAKLRELLTDIEGRLAI